MWLQDRWICWQWENNSVSPLLLLLLVRAGWYFALFLVQLLSLGASTFTVLSTCSKNLLLAALSITPSHPSVRSLRLLFTGSHIFCSESTPLASQRSVIIRVKKLVLHQTPERFPHKMLAIDIGRTPRSWTPWSSWVPSNSEWLYDSTFTCFL